MAELVFLRPRGFVVSILSWRFCGESSPGVQHSGFVLLRFSSQHLLGLADCHIVRNESYHALRQHPCHLRQLRPAYPNLSLPPPISGDRDYEGPGEPTFVKRPLYRGPSRPSLPPRASFYPRLSRRQSLAVPPAHWRQGFSRRLRCSNRRCLSFSFSSPWDSCP